MAIAVPAQAICFYNGKHFEKSDDYAERVGSQKQSQSERDFDTRLYAKTTLRDEFTDAMLVIRGRVISAREIPAPKNKPDADDGVVYRIRVDKVFKGDPVRDVRNYTERNSGGFYLDQGKDYLLFLNPPMHGDPALDMAPGALVVNYNCGRSQLWSKLSAADKKALDAVAAGRK